MRRTLLICARWQSSAVATTIALLLLTLTATAQEQPSGPALAPPGQLKPPPLLELPPGQVEVESQPPAEPDVARPPLPP